MKKAKIMLSALAVLAVVGGALAFSARPFSAERIFCQSTNGACTIPVTSITTLNLGQATRVNPCTTLGVDITTFGLTSSAGACTMTTTQFFTTGD